MDAILGLSPSPMEGVVLYRKPYGGGGGGISQILVIKLQNQTNCHTDVIYTVGFASKNINNAEFYFFSCVRR